MLNTVGISKRVNLLNKVGLYWIRLRILIKQLYISILLSDSKYGLIIKRDRDYSSICISIILNLFVQYIIYVNNMSGLIVLSSNNNNVIIFWEFKFHCSIIGYYKNIHIKNKLIHFIKGWITIYLEPYNLFWSNIHNCSHFLIVWEYYLRIASIKIQYFLLIDDSLNTLSAIIICLLI
jgi:hypothetical protein